MQILRAEQPFHFLIFGASGDLAKLKIFPAIFALAEQKRLPKDYFITGYARSMKDTIAFREEFADAVRTARKNDNWGAYQEEILEELIEHVFSCRGQYDSPEDYESLKNFLASLDSGKNFLKVVYFSVPPSVFSSIVEQLSAMRESKEEDMRLIVEKPFGYDECSARKLFHFIGTHFEEQQIFLLDHYLGKQSVQSILSLRHTNRILNLMMKGRELSNIQITAVETLGVGQRIGYFNEVGAVKDMVQSHLLQILALVTMSIPIRRDAQSVQQEKQAILSALDFDGDPRSLSLGQYEGYKEEAQGFDTSATPTFAAVRLKINRETWFNVPIYLRTGKRLQKKHTNVVLELKKFKFQKPEEEPNRVIIELQPNERIHIRLINEEGVTQGFREIAPSEAIGCDGEHCLPEHGLLLLDVLRNEHLFFLSFPEILASWRVADDIQTCIKEHNEPIDLYPVGSEGPPSQHDLTALDGMTWFDFDPS